MASSAMEMMALGGVTIAGKPYRFFRKWQADQGYAYRLVSESEEIGVCSRPEYRKKPVAWYFTGNGKVIPLVDSYALTCLDNRAGHEELGEYRDWVMVLLRQNHMRIRGIDGIRAAEKTCGRCK